MIRLDQIHDFFGGQDFSLYNVIHDLGMVGSLCHCAINHRYDTTSYAKKHQHPHVVVEFAWQVGYKSHGTIHRAPLAFGGAASVALGDGGGGGGTTASSPRKTQSTLNLFDMLVHTYAFANISSTEIHTDTVACMMRASQPCRDGHLSDR